MTQREPFGSSGGKDHFHLPVCVEQFGLFLGENGMVVSDCHAQRRMTKTTEPFRSPAPLVLEESCVLLKGVLCPMGGGLARDKDCNVNDSNMTQKGRSAS